ncbi:MAG TPA: signal peptide peptidase SppA [Vicinamibacterales bacterium]|nr:signal peptide peptidase SppA [Vicinamibacterales bacterium]
MARRGFTIIFTLLGAALVISIAGFAALYFLVGREPSVPSNSILTLKIGGDLADVAPDDVVGYIRGVRTPTVRSIVDDLRKAKVDDRVSAVLIEPTGLDTPYWGKIDEIRDEILDFRTSGKPAYAYLEYGSQPDYYLASAADKVFLMPSSTLDFSGVATYELFLRGALDKIGVYPDLHHIGNYKTASNTFTEKQYTAAHKEMDESLNRDVYDRIVKAVSTSRKKAEGEIQRAMDDGPFLADQAVSRGLVDELGYEDQVKEKLRAVAGAGQARDMDGEEYARVSVTSLGLDRGPRIAVIYVSGEIASGKSGYDPLNGAVLGSDTLISYIRAARRDSSIRAIILRIDSPGGSAAASDAIWHELMAAKKEHPDRPIVASMSDLAASGGYYVALPADTIVAEPGTLTGSIGIFGGKFVTGGLYEKLGANIQSASIGRHAEMESPARPYNADELVKVQDELDAFYKQFITLVAQSRHSTPEKIDQIGQGRVWTGHQAKDIGLVDELGGLDRAIYFAKSAAKIASDSGVELVVYPPKRSFLELVSDEFSGAGDQASAGKWVSATLSAGEVDTLRVMRGPAAMFHRGEPLALMPFTFLR